LPEQADHRRYRRGGPATRRRALRHRAGGGGAGVAVHDAPDGPVGLRPPQAATPRDPDAGHPRHPPPTRSLLHVPAKPHPPGRTPTLRDIATRKVSIDSKPYIGTPERVADELARTIDAVGGDGFAIRQGIWPGYVGPFVEKVIPLLQKRGAVRTEYAGTTLREHLREF